MTALTVASSFKFSEKKKSDDSNLSSSTIQWMEAIKAIQSSVDRDGDIDNVLNTALSKYKSIFQTDHVYAVIVKNGKSKYNVGPSFDISMEKDPSRGIAAMSFNNRKMIVINDCTSVPRFNRGALSSFNVEDAVSSIQVKNIICSPVFAEEQVIGVIYALNIHSDYLSDDEQQKGNGIDIFESLTNHTSIALDLSTMLRRSLAYQKRLQGLSSILRVRSSDGSLDKLLQVTNSVVDNILSPHLVSIYLCDQSKKEIFVCASKDGMEGLTISYGQGIAGHVAVTMKPVRTDDAYEDPRFLSTVDKFTGTQSSSILCVPVPGFADDSPIALIQVMNNTFGYFDEEDESNLVQIANELSLGLRLRAREIYALRTLGQKLWQRLSFDNVSESMLEESLLQDYGSMAYRYKYRVIGDKIIYGSMSPPEQSPVSNNNKTEKFSAYDNNCSFGRFSLEEASSAINDYNCSPFIYSDVDLVDLAIYMLQSFHLLEALNINVQILHQFLVTIQGLYHYRNPYHNFKHGWSVMHITYNLLRLGLGDCLTALDKFTLLIGAICHDVDHTGYSNNFEIASRSPLSQIYCDDTVLERHHAATTIRHLSMKEFDFMPSVSEADKKYFRKTIIAAIFATDMAKHFEAVEKLTAHTIRDIPFNRSDSEDRLELVKFILHAADIGAQTQSKSLARQWGDCVLEEFSNQHDKEIEIGLDPTPYMIGKYLLVIATVANPRVETIFHLYDSEYL